MVLAGIDSEFMPVSSKPGLVVMVRVCGHDPEVPTALYCHPSSDKSRDIDVRGNWQRARVDYWVAERGALTIWMNVKFPMMA